ncbi:uncharacterized protein LOC142583714 [Dermacentor variabilis]|uniref:uncharacterized protein LOC142583714 n=1 Tax=Dermacentor variabilis TaxID=34621 RepID=UPI003F5C1064
MYVDFGHKTWDEVLPYVTFAYNIAPQETTQMTPFELLFGSQVATMLDVMLLQVEHGNIHADVASFLQRAEDARQLARMSIKEQQNVDARLYNLRRRDQETPVRRRGFSEELLRRYFGPYKVTRRLGPLVYEVVPGGVTESQRRRARPEMVHVACLKKCFER